ncbi:hypothetical protein PR048_026656 [Dryococelus australis]|uniref:Endonuclease/exonuclease/phosphatase domain-containing protein n=1 Tax=Dryococelus australis TaxID=614101 RepID=A0ABQ9GLZ1_9NEOP|nr:hypothetical protein PR048_026656 [Dryococelus australis]
MMNMSISNEPDILNCAFSTLSNHNLTSPSCDDTSTLSVLYLNIRSLRYKLLDVLQLLDELKPKPYVVILSEAWLKDNETIFYNIVGYTKYFSCRNESRGGDLAMHIQDNIPHKIVNCCNTDYYSLWEKIFDHTCKKKFSIGGYYRPPCCCLNSFRVNTNVLIARDFNLNAGKLNDSQFQQYQLVYMSLGLHICNDLPTRITDTSESVIDHLFTNISDKLTISTIDNASSDHNIILAPTS